MKKEADQGMVIVTFGHLLPEDPNYGLPVHCYACGCEHSGYGMALVMTDDESRRSLSVPLCEPCREAEDPDNLIVFKYLDDEICIREVVMQ